MIITLITLVLGITSTFILPEKYLYDALLIYNDPFNEKGLVGSYPVSMWFYDFFMLNRLPFFIIAMIQIPLIFYLFYKQGIPNSFDKLSLTNIVVWFALIAIAVYISIPSKEFINILFVFTVIYLLRKKFSKKRDKILFILSLFLLYGLWFRPYYFLIPFIAFFSFMISRIRSQHKVFNIILSTIVIAIFMSFSYGLIQGEFMSESTREALNEKRYGREDSQTLILSPVKTDSFLGEAIGIAYGYLSVNIPFEGLKFIKKPQVIMFVIWQLSVFVLLYRKYKVSLRTSSSPLETKIWVFHLLFSYFIVQGIFEPDLGSSIRHKLGVLPLIYEALFYEKLNRTT